MDSLFLFFDSAGAGDLDCNGIEDLGLDWAGDLDLDLADFAATFFLPWDCFSTSPDVSFASSGVFSLSDVSFVSSATTFFLYFLFLPLKEKS